MIGFQSFLELYHSLKTHKVRTIFTGFGVMWAMVILVLLHGGGTGFYNGTLKKFCTYSIPKLTIETFNSKVKLTEDLVDKLAYNIHALEQVLPVFQDKHSVAYAEKVDKSAILGVGRGYDKANSLELLEGRFFTERDLEQRLPVCILNTNIKAKLFGSHSAIGQFISIDGTTVGVIGIYEPTEWGEEVCIPLTLFKALFPLKATSVAKIIAPLKPKQNTIKIENQIRTYLARQLQLETKDQQGALYISSGDSRQVNAYQILFLLMQGFIKLVSLCLLVSGVMGLGNMMLVAVKERTQEIAVRKVLGAGSGDIIMLILLESIVITVLSGILGMGIGIALVKGVNRYLAPFMVKHGMAHFELQFPVVVGALVLLVLSGCLAGMIPVKRALHIKPVDALNNDE